MPSMNLWKPLQNAGNFINPAPTEKIINYQEETTMNENKIPTLEEYVAQKEEEHRAGRTMTGDAMFDGLDKQLESYRKDLAAAEYLLARAQTKEHEDNAAKEAAELKAKYEHDLKEVYERNCIEESAVQKAMRQMVHDLAENGKRQEETLRRTLSKIGKV